MSAADDVKALSSTAEAILPANASPIEKAVLCAELARIALVDPTIVATIWNGATCPAKLLPWLARSVSVDVWSPDWDDTVKRSAIINSPLVHRMKGTAYAVKRAVKQYSLNAELKEWWEDDSIPRGHIQVHIRYGTGSPSFSSADQILTMQSVRAAKPKSRVMSETLTTVVVSSSLYGAAAPSARITAFVAFKE